MQQRRTVTHDPPSRPSSPYSIVNGRTRSRRKSQEIPAVKVKNGDEHAPIPGRTARRIIGLAHSLNNGEEPIENILQRNATNLGAIQEQALKKIIDDLCDIALNKGNLMQDEFLSIFHDRQIARTMIHNYISRYRAKSAQIPDEELVLARQELMNFISTYAEDNGSSLYTFLEALKLGYPGIDIYALFKSTPEAIDRLVEQINTAAGEISEDYYRAKMEDDPENFLLDFIINRVTFTRDNTVQVDQQALTKLVRLADDAKYPLEELHVLLHQEIKKIRSAVQGVHKVVYSVRALVKAAERLSRYPLLEDDIGYHELWVYHFQPAIVAARRHKMTDSIRFVDSRHTRYDHIIVPKEVCEPIKTIVDSIQDDCAYLDYLRNTYDYPMPSSNGSGDSNIASLSDNEVIEAMATQLTATGEMITNMIRTALERRPKKDPIHRDCQIFPEIIGCTDIRNLMTWIAYPERFIEQYPHYDPSNGYRVEHKVIAHFSRKMLEFLDVYRKYELREDRQRSKEERDLAEEYLCSSSFLNVRKIRSTRTPIEFRIKAEVDPTSQRLIVQRSRGASDNGQSCLHDAAQEMQSPHYESVYDREILGLNPDAEIILKDPETGIWYLYYPVEQKKFWEIQMTVNGKEMGMLVYGGDGQLIHEKTTQSCVESHLRDKNPENDKKRITFVSNNEEERDVLRKYLQDQHGARFEIVKDTKEKREHQKAKRPGKSDSSKQFSEQREFTGVMKITVPVNTPEGIVHRAVTLEIQIQSMDNMLITNCSDYTPSSHSRTYRPQRVFEGILFRYLFPPSLLGETYDNYYAEGYKGGDKLVA